jgi:TolB protein
MGSRLIWVIALAVALVSCSDDPEPAPTTTTERPGTTTTSTTTGDTQAPGRLAVVDAGGDIVVMGPDGSNRQRITETAGTENRALYMQPIWSPDGSTLSWGQTTGTGFGVGISRPESGLITTLTTPNLPFFTYWSPDSRHLGILHNGTSGVQFQIADIQEETTEVLDEDAPFYFSWSPEGDRVVTHAGSSRVETITPAGERIELQPTTGNYLAPQWTDAGAFHVVGEELILESEDGNRQPVIEVTGLTLFVANTQGTSVAVQATGEDGSGITASAEEFPSARAGVLVVVDVETGETDVVENAPALGFFWSSDGESLLAMTTEDSRIAPVVWSREDGATEYTSFRPPPSMLRDTFPFFPQYAQSVSFWAPDGSAFTFAGEVDGETGIWVQDVAATSPTRVSDGSWVAWSGT